MLRPMPDATIRPSIWTYASVAVVASAALATLSPR
jgi:hypothetical protein